MRILQIDVSVNIGSTGRIAEEIGLKIIKANDESYIAYGRYSMQSASKVIKIGTYFDQAWHLLQTRIFDRHGLHSVNATKKLINQIEKINPDIVHLHQIHGYYLNIILLLGFLRSSGKPIVWTFHDCWQFTGHCCHFSRIDCMRWKSVCHDCPLLNTYPKSWVFDHSSTNYKIKKDLLNRLDHLTIVPVSYWLENVVKESFLTGHPIQTIQHGIDASKFRMTDSTRLREKHGLQEKKVILGIASYWSETKGLEDFISISRIIDSSIKIVLIGLNKAQIRKLPENVIGIQRTENIYELSEYYSLADVFLNPSRFESFGLVTVEAMACGTPVVVYNSTASPELVDNGSTGYIVEKDDINSMFDAAMTIIKKGKEAFSSNCVERVHNNYNKDIQFLKYIELYKNVLNTQQDLHSEY
ncbi:MAG: glycosyl transferase [Flavobacterium sp.]|nr:glycosyl transferase [Flavobacterium sp.]